MPGRKFVSTLHWPENDSLSFFKFLQKKVSWLGKRNFLHLLNESRGFATWFPQITTPKVIQKMCRSFFVKPGNFFNVTFNWPINSQFKKRSSNSLNILIKIWNLAEKKGLGDKFSACFVLHVYLERFQILMRLIQFLKTRFLNWVSFIHRGLYTTNILWFCL